MPDDRAGESVADSIRLAAGYMAAFLRNGGSVPVPGWEWYVAADQRTISRGWRHRERGYRAGEPVNEAVRLARRGRSLTRRIAEARLYSMERTGIARRLHREHQWTHAQIAAALGVNRQRIGQMLAD